MKNKISSINLLAFSLLFILLPGIIACKKDKLPTFRESIVGTWTIKSFTIDGVEIKGTVVKSSKMEFEKYSGSNGDFEWNIFYTDGTADIQTGDYELDEIDKEIKLENEEGDRLKFDFELEDNDLELSGILDGERYVLKAKRN